MSCELIEIPAFSVTYMKNWVHTTRYCGAQMTCVTLTYLSEDRPILKNEIAGRIDHRELSRFIWQRIKSAISRTSRNEYVVDSAVFDLRRGFQRGCSSEIFG